MKTENRESIRKMNGRGYAAKQKSGMLIFRSLFQIVPVERAFYCGINMTAENIALTNEIARGIGQSTGVRSVDTRAG